jgi:SRSO17 transposase
MAGASIETTLELWTSSLREVKARIRPLFRQERVAACAGQFLDGLLGNEPRKTGWMRAEAAGDPGPWRQQAILGRGRWDADALRDMVRGYALETLADKDAVLVVDETGFLKQGKASCGVARQYTGSAGKIANCQIGVFASYVSRHGHAFVDRALYLPKEWTDDPGRLKAAKVPDEVGFATKPQIARRMIARAVAAKVPFSFVAADSVYGTGEIETMLRKAGKGYVLGVAANHVFHSWGKRQCVGGSAAKLAQNLPKSAWRRLSAGEGTKGPRLHDWAYLELADLDAGDYNSTLTGEWTRGLLIRRTLAGGDLAFFSTWCWSKAIAGLSKTASRPPRTNSASITTKAVPRPWLAPACLVGHAGLRHDGQHPSSGQCRATQKNPAAPSGETSLLIRWSMQEIRRIAMKLAQRRIQPAYVIAWSLWRRAHQAEARRAHLKNLKKKMQL